MRTWPATSGAAALLVAMATMTLARADDVLKICLDENLPPLSVHHRGAPDRGFDVTLAQAVAERLGRSFKIQWFESKLDEDSSPALEANALLSDGRCSLVGGYALTKDSLLFPASRPPSCLISTAPRAMIAGAVCRSACWCQARPISIRR